jgi:hypothetical protein
MKEALTDAKTAPSPGSIPARRTASTPLYLPVLVTAPIIAQNFNQGPSDSTLRP